MEFDLRYQLIAQRYLSTAQRCRSSAQRYRSSTQVRLRHHRPMHSAICG